MGNPNPFLECRGNLLEADSEWYYIIAGSTLATFVIPGEKPLHHLLLGLCCWYVGENQTPRFQLSFSFASHILSYYEAKGATKQGTRVRGMAEYTKAQEELGREMAHVLGTQGLGADRARADARSRPPTPKRSPVK